MGHYAKIKNDIVVQVDVIDEEYFEENKNSFYKGKWIQTSYNTRAGVHLLGGTPLRKNYAGIGFTYDEERDAFIPPKPSENYELDEETCQWKKVINEETEEQ
jgi:hypothetical protein